MVLLLLLAAAPAPDAKALLEQKLSKERAAGQVDVRTDGDVTAVRILRDDVYEKLDPLWKTLGSAAQASKRGPVRVDLTHLDAKGCDDRRMLVERYLFEKQKADRARLTVRATCGAGFPEPAEASLGALTLTASQALSPEYQPITGVPFLVENTSDAGVELTVERLELRAGQSLQRETPPPPWTVPIDGLWFHALGVQGAPYVQVREHGVGPLRFVVPPSSEVQVMLQLSPVHDRVSFRRITVSVGDQRATVAGTVAKIGFFEGFVPGRRTGGSD
ncbi:MAG: hypothetical protein JNJ54_33140 [Myxococcaceae bacterium]|nr:hypothetical protein [Myxococcaceae bacterium]